MISLAVLLLGLFIIIRADEAVETLDADSEAFRCPVLLFVDGLALLRAPLTRFHNRASNLTSLGGKNYTVLSGDAAFNHLTTRGCPSAAFVGLQGARCEKGYAVDPAFAAGAPLCVPSSSVPWARPCHSFLGPPGPPPASQFQRPPRSAFSDLFEGLTSGRREGVGFGLLRICAGASLPAALGPALGAAVDSDDAVRFETTSNPLCVTANA